VYVARPFQVKVLSASLASPVPIVMSTGSGVPTGAFCPALITNKLTGVGNFPGMLAKETRNKILPGSLQIASYKNPVPSRSCSVVTLANWAGRSMVTRMSLMAPVGGAAVGLAVCG
jgi:hypothetical protein